MSTHDDAPQVMANADGPQVEVEVAREVADQLIQAPRPAPAKRGPQTKSPKAGTRKKQKHESDTPMPNVESTATAPEETEAAENVVLDTWLRTKAVDCRSQAPMPKIKVCELTGRDGYDAWRYKLSGTCAMLGISELVAMVAILGPGATVPRQSAEQISGTDAAVYAYVGACVQSKLEGEALTLCCSGHAQNLGATLRILGDAHGVVQEVDRMCMQHALHSERYEPEREELSQWVSKKQSAALKLGHTFAATEDAFDRNMKTVLLTLLPPQFDGVANEMRASPPPTWHDVVRRLRDLDAAQRQCKQEVQGYVYRPDAGAETTRIQKLEQRVESLLQRTQNDQRRCYACGKRGHIAAKCRSKSKGKGKGTKNEQE